MTRIFTALALSRSSAFLINLTLPYLDKNDDKSEWKQIDPYMEAVSGYESFDKLTPVRIMWGQLSENSDLSDINLDLFVVTAENFQLRNFTNPSAQSGYITSQLNERAHTGEVSVLGESTSKISINKDLKYSALYIMTGVGMLLISAMIFRREYQLNLKIKSRS